MTGMTAGGAREVLAVFEAVGSDLDSVWENASRIAVGLTGVDWRHYELRRVGAVRPESWEDVRSPEGVERIVTSWTADFEIVKRRQREASEG